MRDPKAEYLKRQIDSMARKLWCACRDLSDCGEPYMRPCDLDLWEAATKHDGVQSALSATPPQGEEW